MGEADRLKLSYCPFCGSTRVELIAEQDMDEFNWYHVLCRKCYTTSDSYCSEESAVSAWNRRSLTIDSQPESSILTAEVGYIPLDKQFQIIGMGAYLLASITDNTDHNGNIKKIHHVMRNFTGVRGHIMDLLEVDFTLQEAMFRSIFRENEFTIQTMFNSYAGRVIPGAKVVKRKNEHHNMPDSWIEIDGEEIPVEVKYGNFNERAMDQLNRYVRAYSCKRGVAVGRALKTELPEGYIFVSIDELRAAQAETENDDERGRKKGGASNED